MTDLAEPLIESPTIADRLRAALPTDVDHASARLVDDSAPGASQNLDFITNTYSLCHSLDIGQADAHDLPMF